MLAYVADHPIAGKRQSSPNALLLIISAHVALIAAVMSARMELPPRIHPGPIIVDFPRDPPPPPPNSTDKPPPRRSSDLRIDHPDPANKIPANDPASLDTGKTSVDPGPPGGGTIVGPEPGPQPIIEPVHHDPRLLTPTSELKPPYPPSKILSEEQAVLRLKLTIDARGRVVAVDPIGRADRDFLEAARRHLLAHWRYQPATDDGRAVTSFLLITLRFQLDG